MTVNITGEYRVDHTFVLDARDSGRENAEVIYRAAPGAKPVISGAIRVDNWSLQDAKLNIWRAYVGPRSTRQLYVNGERATRARTEPYPATFAPSGIGYHFVGSGTMPVWSNYSSIEAVTVTQWKMMRCPVRRIFGTDVEMQQPCWNNANVYRATPPAKPLWNFQLLSHFENAYEFLDEPGEWYLDSERGWLFYIPREGEDLATVDVEMPAVEVLVDGQGERERPIHHLRFEGITFTYATWLAPNGPNGYVADQSGLLVVGDGHRPNVIGHDPDVVPTPGNVRFRYAQNVTFAGNAFSHLGGVALEFGTGSQSNEIVGNTFDDISSGAIVLGGVAKVDHHPPTPTDLTRDNHVANNLIHATGRDYFDTAGIFLGFTTRSLVEHNDIVDVPWAGIAIGWGWGLVDPGSFPGLPGAYSGEWGNYTTPTASQGNIIVHNRIENFLMELWDGGAIYTQGQQGTSILDGELIAWNVASGKRKDAGGNTFYTDGGSRYVTLLENVSYDNPQGVTDFGPCGLASSLSLCFLHLPYGSDMGGCVPYGDLVFMGNYWVNWTFYNVCPYKDYPVNVAFVGNQLITDKSQVPQWILDSAGRQTSKHRPAGRR